MTLPLPRYVIAKPLAGGATAFYFNVPTRYRALGCSIRNEPLGSDYSAACGADGTGGRAGALNALFDEWLKTKSGEPLPGLARYGSVDWLFREFKSNIRFREKVSERSRPDYERSMLMVADMVTKAGDRVGDRPVKSITPAAADKIYDRLCQGPRGERLRQAEKVVAICRGAWRVVRRLSSEAFDRAVPNPWEGVTKKRRTKAIKPAATREQVYRFASGAIEAGRPEIGAAASCVSSSCSDPRMSSPAISLGLTTGPKMHPAPSGSCITRRERQCGIRWRKRLTAAWCNFMRTRRRSWRACRAWGCP
jgi:hypothetical protein